MDKLLSTSKISYIKWDMNRSITEAFSAKLPADQQGEVFHRYILNVYDLFNRLNTKFPHVLFESCSSGGGRFDAGLCSIGSHVSACPNHQLNRTTPFSTRANVAYFGTFGYELDLNKLTDKEREMVREQIKFMKEYREVIQLGYFYRILNQVETNFLCWMAVSPDKKTAIVGYYKILNEVNGPYRRVYLQGLDLKLCYHVNGDKGHSGSELMNAGLIVTDGAAGWADPDIPSRDFDSRIYVLKA